jgi:hypothetical protein
MQKRPRTNTQVSACVYNLAIFEKKKENKNEHGCKCLI